ncbi:unnamed protein product [Peronospora farinosa]|uniref:SAP domain-containing protein n=1 Tax=Peronospora farinosa TaxID=134698 RepID=A0AAV0T1F2_9STRA|nr:unnamed protein product [Peronospora farinosa]CAI5712788.1 unnamed protein product [Peronospora farinosa]
MKRVIEFVEAFPPEADAIELKHQLSAFTRDDLRAACSRLKLSVRDGQKNKSDFIYVLISYWDTSNKNLVPKCATTPLEASEPPVEAGIEQPFDVAREEKVGTFDALVEKARAVKEWASTIEMSSRVEGGEKSIERIRKIIDGVLDSAMSEL